MKRAFLIFTLLLFFSVSIFSQEATSVFSPCCSIAIEGFILNDIDLSLITGGTDPDAGVGTNRRPIWPTESHRITTGFTNKHGAVDIGGVTSAKKGDGVKASMAGKVTMAGVPSREESASGSSNIRITGVDGVEYRYLHCDSIKVSKGDWVFKGQDLAKMSDIGSPGDIHLHYENRIGKVNIDPRKR